MDPNKSSNYTSQQLQSLTQLFEKIDNDGDKIITLSELKDYLQKSEFSSNKDLQSLLESSETNETMNFDSFLDKIGLWYINNKEKVGEDKSEDSGKQEAESTRQRLRKLKKHSSVRINESLNTQKLFINGENKPDLSLAQLTQMRKIFDTLDKDGNGVLDINELAEAMGQDGRQVSSDDVQKAMLLLDKDHNQKIDFDEFVLGLGHLYLQGDNTSSQQLSTTIEPKEQQNKPIEPPSSPIQKLFLRVVFPKEGNYSIESKVIGLDPNITAGQAIRTIQREWELDINPNIGLYIPESKLWIEDATVLSQCKYLDVLDTALVEYRDRNIQINLGNVTSRRRQRLTSPHYKDWQESFKESLRKGEEKKRKQEYLKKEIPEDVQEELQKLASPRRNLSRTFSEKTMHGSITDASELKLKFLEQNIQEKDSKLKSAVEIGKKLLQENMEMKSQIERYRARTAGESDLHEIIERQYDEIATLETRCLVYESQMEEAAKANADLTKDNEIKLKEIDTLRNARKNQSGKKELLEDEIEQYKKELQKAQEDNESFRNQIQKLKTEKEKLKEKMENAEVEQSTQDETQLETLRIKTKELNEKNKELQKKIRKMELNQSRERGLQWSENSSCEAMLQKLDTIVSASKLSKQEPEEEFFHLSQAEKLIQQLRAKLEAQVPVSVAGCLMSLLEQKINITGLTKPQVASADINQLDIEELDESVLFFLLALLSLSVEEELEKSLQTERKKEQELKDDLEEIKSQLQIEKRNRGKLEEQGYSDVGPSGNNVSSLKDQLDSNRDLQNSQFESLMLKKTELEALNHDLREKLQRTEHALKEEQTKRGDLEKKVKILESTLNGETSEVRALKEIQIELDTTQKSLASEVKNGEALREKIKKLKEKQQKLREENEELREEFEKQLEEKNEEFKEEFRAESEKKFEELLDHQAGVEKENRTLKQQLQEINQSIPKGSNEKNDESRPVDLNSYPNKNEIPTKGELVLQKKHIYTAGSLLSTWILFEFFLLYISYSLSLDSETIWQGTT